MGKTYSTLEHINTKRGLCLSRLFAFVDIFVEAPEMDNVVSELSKLKNLEELYEVTGEFDIVTSSLCC